MRVLTFIGLAVMASAAPAQQSGHGHGRTLLLLARADGGEVAPEGVRSAASATAAVLIDRREGRLSYDLTYHGMASGGPSQIALYNSGPGRNGPTVAILCGGGDERRCPQLPAARLSGGLADLRLPPRLLSEFASGRIYLQIDDANGRPEIRGQVEPNGAMVPVRNYIAQLAPRPGGAATGEGTAVLSEAFLPGGRVAVEYSVTVAGTSGTPEAVSLSGVSQPGDIAAARFLRTRRLPVDREEFGTRARGGGSFSGRYVADSQGEKARLTFTQLVSTGTPAVAVRTSRFPAGELVGVFRPVE